MSAELKSTSHGKTMVLTLSNPEQRNALDPEIYAAGVEALNIAESNDDIRTVVITGEGAMFCAGGNLKRLQTSREQASSMAAQGIEGLHNWIESIRTFPKPVIAAVEGAAAGAGFSLALACDLMVSANNAVFVMAYSNIALSPDGAASWSLGRVLTRQLTNEILMMGERLDAQRLYSLGLVNRLTPPGSALTESLLLAQRLNDRAPNALTSIKELINDVPTSSLSQQLALERAHFLRNLQHANAGIGIEAFLTKQMPHYK
jgi:enoyl-CoA hydratase/carnithine racemase